MLTVITRIGHISLILASEIHALCSFFSVICNGCTCNFLQAWRKRELSKTDHQTAKNSMGQQWTLLHRKCCAVKGCGAARHAPARWSSMSRMQSTRFRLTARSRGLRPYCCYRREDEYEIEHSNSDFGRDNRPKKCANLRGNAKQLTMSCNEGSPPAQRSNLTASS